MAKSSGKNDQFHAATGRWYFCGVDEDSKRSIIDAEHLKLLRC